jgi:hypothetical protein
VPKCHACGFPITEGASVRLTFEGFTTLALNGVTFRAHAACVRLVIPDNEIPLAERVSDPEAEPANPGQCVAA